MNNRERTETWSLVAGDVALDYVNTVGGFDWNAHMEAIADYGLLLVWSVRAGTIDQAQADRLGRRARRSPEEADEVPVGGFRRSGRRAEPRQPIVGQLKRGIHRWPSRSARPGQPLPPWRPSHS